MFGGLTLYASAAAPSFRAALVSMIGVWGLCCLIIPRAATEIAGALRPLPSQAELARAVKHSLEKGVDGKTDRKVALEAITSDLMADQGHSNTGMLMRPEMTSYEEGIQLQARAQWENQAYDHHLQQLDDRIAAQEQLVAWMGLLSPYIAMRTLSAGLCGTDFAHHRHFTEYAESWRKALVAQLDKAFAENAGVEGYDYRAGPELWNQAPPFSYATPGPAFALRSNLSSILALLIWLGLALGLALRSARRVRLL